MKNFFTSCLFTLALFFSGSVWAQTTTPPPQDIVEAGAKTATNRPEGGKFGFNLFMSLSSNSEESELTYRGISEEQSLYTTGLGMSFRWYLTDHLAARGGLSFFNYREKENVSLSPRTRLSGIRAWQSRLGLMLAIKGTDQLEPYLYLDGIFGRSQLRRNDSPGGQIERTELLSSIGAVPGIGFNYYFAKNIAVGAEMGIGIMRYNFAESDVNHISFRSGANANLGISVFF